MKAQRVWILPVLALALLGAAGCGDDSESSGSAGGETTAGSSDAAGGGGESGAVQVRIAHIADLTGPAKTANEAHVRGMDLALDVLAEAGEVEITIDRSDTSGDVARATATMNEVVNDDSIVWQFGPANTGEFFAAIPIAEQLEMPIQSVSSGGVFTDEFNEFTFRTSFAENAASDALIAFLQEDLGVERIAAAYANDNDFARTSAEFFIGAAEDAGLDVATQQTFSSQDISYSTQAAEIADADPEAVYVATNVNAGLLVKALRDAGIDVPIVATNNTFHTPSNVFETSGGATDTVRFVAPFLPEDPRPVVQDFIARFAEKYPGVTPGVQEALGYDAVMMLAAAAASVDGELTRESLREAFAAVEYEGVTGANITFPDGKGDAHREGIHILTIEAPGVAVAAEG